MSSPRDRDNVTAVRVVIWRWHLSRVCSVEDCLLERTMENSTISLACQLEDQNYDMLIRGVCQQDRQFLLETFEKVVVTHVPVSVSLP